MADKDQALGQVIKSVIAQNDCESPLLFKKPNGFQDKTNKKTYIAGKFSSIMEMLDLDLENDSLADTPKRVAKMFVDEIFYGLDYNNFPKCTVNPNDFRADEMVVTSGSVHSFCEHHFLPFYGSFKIAYIPKDNILGLSKFGRIVDFFARRPQVQERLIMQIFVALKEILGTEDIAVELTCEHHCVKSRGVMDCGSETSNSKLGGVFSNSAATRSEFYSKKLKC